MRKALRIGLLVLGGALPAAVTAGVVTGLTTFNNGSVADAAAVNTNFTAVKTAVDDNAGRIAALELRDAPTGTVIAYLKSFTGTPALSSAWVECNGQVLSDASSPYNGRTLPNLNAGNRFLRGNTASGATGGAETHNHGVTQTSTDLAPDNSHFPDGTAINPANHLPPYYDVVWIMKVK